MSLQNLATIGQLIEHETDKEQVGKLMDASTRKVAVLASRKQTRLAWLIISVNQKTHTSNSRLTSGWH